MSKKKKHKDGAGHAPRQFSAADLERSILDLFQRLPQERFDVKQIARKLHASNPYQAIEGTLDKLRQMDVITLTRSGKYKSKTAGDAPAETRATDAVIGTVDMTRWGDAYIVSDQKKGKDIFVPRTRMKGALHGDTVRVRWKTGRRGRPEGSVTEVIQRKTIHFVGTLGVAKNKAFVSPDDPRIGQEIWLDKANLKGAKPNDKVVVAIRQWQTDNPEGLLHGEVMHNLGKAGSNDAEMQGILIQNGFNVAFPEEVEAESEAISTEISAEEISRRRDFRSILTFTIDPEDAKDFDDAISLELLPNGHYEIGVHIADVSHYVRPDSMLDKEAARRTTSVYLVDRVAPMLPEKLSNGVCSLRPMEEKLTFSAVFEFSAEGKIVNEWFGRTVIRSARRYAYEEVQAILESGEGDYVNELKIVNRYAQQLRKERFKRGAINFESNEVKFRLDENGKPQAIIPKIRKEAHFLIEEFMLLANRRVATFVVQQSAGREQNIPFVYRIHDEPDMEKIEDFMRFARELGYQMEIKTAKQVAPAFAKMQEEAAGKPELDVLQQLGIRTMAKAAYSIENIGHYGLAFENYTHFTSPIRRYSDVLSHRILWEVLNNGSKIPAKDTLEAQCKHISAMERKAMEAERESIKYKQAEYMQDHVGDMFEGVISGITDFGVFVELLANYCEGMVKIENMYDDFVVSDGGMHLRSRTKTYKMGDKVWVLILGADPHKRQIDMRLLDETKIQTTTVAETKPADTPVEAQPKPAKTKTTKKSKDTPPPAVQESPVQADKPVEAAPVVQPKEEEKKSRNKKTPKTTLPEPPLALPPAEEPVALVEAPEPPAALLPPPPKTKIDKELRTIWDMVEAAYKRSEVAFSAADKKQAWYFSLLETALHKQVPAIVNFIPDWVDNPQQPSLYALPTNTLRTSRHKKWHNVAQYVETYLGAADKTVVVPFCPFHHPANMQPSAATLKASRPAFDRLITYLKPTVLLVFSSELRSHWINEGYLANYEEQSIAVGKRTIISGKGVYTVGKVQLPVYVLPHPNAALSVEQRKGVWQAFFGEKEE